MSTKRPCFQQTVSFVGSQTKYSEIIFYFIFFIRTYIQGYFIRPVALCYKVATGTL